MVAVPMPMNRDLFVTLDRLRAEGLDARLRVFEGSVEASIDGHAASFASPDELHDAANWLAERALMRYPNSAFVKMWLVLARAAAGVAARG